MRLSAAFILMGWMVVSLVGCGGSSYKLIESGPQRPQVPAKVIVTEFKDERSFDRKLASSSKAAPFTISKSYFLSRPEETFTNQEAFPVKMAKSLAENLEKGGHFDEVQFASAEEMPDRGTYDLRLSGTLKETTARGRANYYGLVLPLGFQFSDILWYLGAPKLTRRYDLAMDIQMYNGYTGEPIGKPIPVEYETDGKSFTVYADEGKLEDLNKKVVAVWNEYIEALHKQQPTGDEQYWANLRSEGERYLASQAREQELIRKGSPPVFTFISPTDGTTVRNASTTVRWSLTSPNGLKSLAVALNNQPIETNVRAVELSDPDKAPRGLSAQETPVQLKMGRNVIEARVNDHRGNAADASLTITRLPLALLPAQRYALVIGAGSSAASDTAQGLASVLKDPALGQFDERNVRVVTSSSFSMDQLSSALAEFGPKAKSGDLALIYIAVPGNAATGSLGADGMKLSQLTEMLRRGVATEDVVLLLDIDWSGTSSDDVIDMLGNLPSRWAVAVSANEAMPAQQRSGKLVFGQSIADIIAGRNVQATSVTLERLFDLVEERAAVGGAEPQTTGRFNPNVTMAEFQ